jgi:hypothetical protein
MPYSVEMLASQFPFLVGKASSLIEIKSIISQIITVYVFDKFDKWESFSGYGFMKK